MAHLTMDEKFQYSDPTWLQWDHRVGTAQPLPVKGKYSTTEHRQVLISLS